MAIPIKHTIRQEDLPYRYIDEYHLCLGGEGFYPPQRPTLLREPHVCKKCKKAYLSLYPLRNCGHHIDLETIDFPPPIKRPYRDMQKILELKVEIAKERGYLCELCGADKQIEMHHIKDFHNHPELGYDKNNVILLCSSCRLTTRVEP